MKGRATYIQLALIIIIGTEWELSSSTLVPEIRLELSDSCRTEAKFEWLIFEDDKSLANCSIVYERKDIFYSNSSIHLEQYPKLKNSGSFTVKELGLGENYSIQIICGTIHSNVLTFSIEDKACSSSDNEDETSDTPVVFKQETSLLGTKDSVLGIVFALFGLLIIIVTTFYIVRKIRRRQRLERIRRYLGSSLIDPFENMQDREQVNGSERLIGAAES